MEDHNKSLWWGTKFWGGLLSSNKHMELQLLQFLFIQQIVTYQIYKTQRIMEAQQWIRYVPYSDKGSYVGKGPKILIQCWFLLFIIYQFDTELHVLSTNF